MNITNSNQRKTSFIHGQLKILIFFLLIHLLPVQAGGLSGEYLIGPDPSDFEDLASAITEIDKVGISGPVFLLLKPGDYPVHVNIDNIPRLNQQDDMLTIQSAEPGNPTFLNHEATSATDNWLIRLDGVSYISITGLNLEIKGTTDFANGVVLDGGSSHISIRDNVLVNHPSSGNDPSSASSVSASTASALSHITVADNTFDGGSSAIFLAGTNTNRASHITIDNNQFNEQLATANYYTVLLSFINDLTFTNNSISNHISNTKGVFVSFVNDALINANRIAMLGGGIGGNGLGLSLNNVNNTGEFLVSNNTIIAARRALTLFLGNENIKIYHNSLLAAGDVLAGSDSYALLVDSMSNQNIDIQNNIISSKVDEANAYVMLIADSTAITTSNHNVFYGLPILDFEFSVNGNNYPAFADYQASTFFDNQSLAKEITFVDEVTGDLHLDPLQYADPDLITLPIAEVPFDLDGDLRSTQTPLIGADELDNDAIFINGFE